MDTINPINLFVTPVLCLRSSYSTVIFQCWKQWDYQFPFHREISAVHWKVERWIQLIQLIYLSRQYYVWDRRIRRWYFNVGNNEIIGFHFTEKSLQFIGKFKKNNGSRKHIWVVWQNGADPYQVWLCTVCAYTYALICWAFVVLWTVIFR